MRVFQKNNTAMSKHKKINERDSKLPYYIPLRIYEHLTKLYPGYAGLVWMIMALPEYHYNSDDRGRLAVCYWTRPFINANSTHGRRTANGKYVPTDVLLQQVLTMTGIKVVSNQRAVGNSKYTLITDRILPTHLQCIWDQVLKEEVLYGPRVDGRGRPYQVPLKPQHLFTEEQEEISNILHKQRRKWKGSRIDEALEIVRNRAESLPEGNERNLVIATLLAVCKCTQPRYKPVRNSRRLYVDGLSILLLPRAIRHAFLEHMGWMELDLLNCQYLLACQMWDVSVSFLPGIASGASLWELIQAILPGLPKDTIKRAVYSILFGGSFDRNTKGGIEIIFAETGATEYLDQFKEIPEIRALVEARTKALNRVSSIGGITISDGTFIPLVRAQDVSSLLAQQIQDMETQLMWPIVRSLENQRGTQVLALIHDGIWVSTENEKRTFLLAKRTLSKVAKTLGVPAGINASSPTFSQSCRVGVWPKTVKK